MSVILHMHPEWGATGGAEIYLGRFCSDLASRGHRGVVLCGKADPACDIPAGVEVHVLPELAGDTLGRRESEYAQVTELVRRVSPHLIIVHGFNVPALLRSVGRLAPALRYIHDLFVVCPRGTKKIKILRDAHCGVRGGWACGLLCPQRDWAQRWRQALQITELRRAHTQFVGLLVGSQAMRHHLSANGYPSPAIHILHPLLPMFDAAYREPPPEPRVLFVGRLGVAKGVHDLVKMAKVLQRNKVDFHLRIVGTGPSSFEADLRQRLRGLPVSLAGRLDSNEIRNEMLAASVVVVPSRWPEPFGMVGPEAMAAGRPIVAYDVGGVREWLTNEQTGLLVPEGNIPLLAAAVENLLAAPNRRRQMGLLAHQRAEGFLPDQHYQQFTRILEHACPAVAGAFT